MSICAKDYTICTDGFDEVFSRQYGDWHCVTIIDSGDEQVWNFAEKVAEKSGGAVISANCVSSDFAERSIYIDGSRKNTFFIGQQYWDDEMPGPDYDVWRPYVTGEKDLEQFIAESADCVFAERALEDISSVFGFPLIVLG